ncbi:MAG: hypothetical protein ACJ74Y_15325, partial [Bryobacteraceae bacterium]
PPQKSECANMRTTPIGLLAGHQSAIEGYFRHALENELNTHLNVAGSPETWLRHGEDRLLQRNRQPTDNYSALAVFRQAAARKFVPGCS